MTTSTSPGPAPARFGVTDLPLESGATDGLGIQPYYEGLARFLQHCQAPMTVAIQGDWGSGKTSAMRLVMERLKDRGVPAMEFNTWQYSQFDLGEKLPLLLLSSIAGRLQPESERRNKHLSSLGKSVLHILATTGGKAAGAWVGVDGGKLVDAVVDEFSGEPLTVVDQMVSLRTQFEEAVQAYLKREGRDRLVIFIDDLDRLEPRRAVEVMECLKLFMESKDCVFVLAIDFEVVVTGVNEKYKGAAGALEAKKARSFFDKIIQVPFRMPVRSYQISDLLATTMRTFGVDITGNLDAYADAAGSSVGHNPRALKRLLNTFNLLSAITSVESRADDSAPDQLLLFLLLCAQAAFPDFHDAIAAAPQTFIDWQPEDGEIDEAWKIDAAEAPNFRNFAKQLGETCHGRADVLARALELSSVTSTGRTPGRTRGKGSTTAQGRHSDLLASRGQRAAELGSALDATLAEVLGERCEVWSQGASPHIWTLKRAGAPEQRRRGGTRLAMATFAVEGLRLDIGQQEYPVALHHASFDLVQRCLDEHRATHSTKVTLLQTGKLLPQLKNVTEDDLPFVAHLLAQVWELQQQMLPAG